MKNLDFAGLNQTLLSNARTLLPEWLPGGKTAGNEYTCSDLSGGNGTSLSINLSKGVWKDFASGEAGGDLISLFAAINNIGNGDAFKRLNDMYGTTGLTNTGSTRTATQAKEQYKFVAPPKGTSYPPFKSKPSAVYKYKDINASVLFLIARHDFKDKKVFAPWSWTTEGKWVKKAWPSPRPLYNLDRIHARPKLPILICEGEKAADAAHAFCGVSYNVTTWPNGASAFNKADWSPIYGKSVLIWPDADDPGRKAAHKIIEMLQPHVKEIKIIDTTGFNGGRDAADFGFESMNEFVTWAKPLVNKIEPQPEPLIPEVMTDQRPIDDGDPGPEPPPQTVINNNLVMGSEDDIPVEATRSEIALWEKLGLSRNKIGNPYVNSLNISKIIRKDKFLKGHIWYDEFHMNVYTDLNWFGKNTVPPRPWSESDRIELMQYIQGEISIHNCKKEMVKDAVLASARRNTRNEPKDWMETLEWDGESRVENFGSVYLSAEDDPDYITDLSKNFWISMVARVFKPGCKVDNMIILEGSQGLRKSTALSVIGGKWFADSPANIGTKDFYLSLQGKLVIEIAELAGFSKADAEKIKQAISSPTDRFRVPYEAAANDHPRQCVFTGTTNQSEYLVDATGARRFWPIKCSKIDIEALKSDRDQLFAEAVHLYKAGETWYEKPRNAEIHQEQRRDNDIWEGTIADWLESPMTSFKNVDFVTIQEIALNCLDIDYSKQDKRTNNRIGACLRSLGWESRVTKFRASQRSVRGFFKIQDQGSDTNSEMLVTSDLPNFAPKS